VDILRQLLDPSGPPPNAQSLILSKHPLFFYSYYVLPLAIQFHLFNTFSLNSCATAINIQGYTMPKIQGLHQ